MLDPKSLLLQYTDALMSNPFYCYADGLMGVWYDFYMNMWLQTYYLPMAVAGQEDQWSQQIAAMLRGSNLCKP